MTTPRSSRLQQESTAMKRSNRYVPTLADRLEDRLVLSQAAIHHAAHIVHHRGQINRPMGAIVLNGTIEGASPLAGSGTVTPLGSVTSKGSLAARGAEPVVYSGTVTLVGAKGSITASLTGLLIGPQRLGQKVTLTDTITGGTGAFRGATGSGKVIYSPIINSPAGDFALTFGTATPPS
jgi:hypothetical protein